MANADVAVYLLSGAVAVAWVYFFTFDDCQFGERYRHRQVLVTNLPCFARLSRDCDGRHEHLTLGFHKDLKTSAVTAFAWGLVREWARLFGEFVAAPRRDYCIHCAAATSTPVPPRVVQSMLRSRVARVLDAVAPLPL